MKLDKLPEQDQLTIAGQNEARKTPQFIGRLKMQKGQKVFELNMKSGFITVAEVETVANIKGGVRRKLVIKEGCLYAPAINIKNAEKKFIKML